jgi:TRAP-type C4-dicarboxylate transport system permease small subunit
MKDYNATMNKKWQFFYKIEEYTAAVLLLGATLVIFFAAVFRSFDRPLNWSLDIALFLFAWSVFLSAEVAMRKGNLVNVDFLVQRFPQSVQRVLGILIYLAILVFLATLVGFGLYLSYVTRARAFQGIPTFSYTWITLSVPVGGSLCMINCVRMIRGFIKAPPEKISPTAQDGETL